MSTYGYVRKDFPCETIKQLEILLPYKVDNIFIDELDYKKQNEWENLLSKVEQDDEIIIISLTIFGKNITELLPMLNLLFIKKIHLISLEEQLDTRSQPNFFKDFEILLRFEQTIFELKKENKNKCNFNLPNVKSKLGRPRIDSEKIERMEYLFKTKNLSLREIAIECDVSLGAVHKYVKRFKEEEYLSI